MSGLSAEEAGLLRACFALALEAREEGNLPFACLVADEAGNVVLTEKNAALVPRRDPTAHAEAVAASEAGRRFTPTELANLTLYSNAEPCAMCAGAIYWAGIGRVVYGLAERDLLALTGDHRDNPTMDLPCREVFAAGQRKVEVLGPALAEEAAEVFALYWG